jgi:hypothetical protein
LLYPPSTFVVMSVAAAWPWDVARPLWAAINTLSILGSMVLIGRLAGLKASTRRGWLLAAAGLALAPVHTNIALGQVAGPVLLLISGGLWDVQQHRRWRGGVWLGLAMAIKPQIGLAFLLYWLARRQWAAAGVAVATAGAMGTIGAARLAIAGVEWWAMWQANVDAFFVIGPGNPTRQAPMSFQLINLHYLLHTVIDSTTAVKAVAWMIVAGLVGGLAWRVRRSGGAGGSLVIAAAVGVIDLLAVYHRPYDAVLLLLVLGWAMAWAGRRGGAWPWVALAGMGAFLTPGAAMLYRLQEMGYVPDALAAGPLWDVLLMPHQVWALIGLAVVHMVVGGKKPLKPADSL